MHKKKWAGKIKQMLICTALALCLGMWANPPCYAQRLVKPEMVLPEHYPDGFNGCGHIDSIKDDLVVIDDIPYKLSPYVVYNSPARRNVSMGYFPPGVFAGFLTNAEDEVISLWLIE